MGEAIIVRRSGGSGGDASLSTATTNDILSGKTAYIDDSGEQVTGTMTNNGSVVITPKTTNQTIAQGYHNGSGYVKGDSDLVSSNIKDGVDIFGVVGNATSDATATAETILVGYGGYKNGTKINGTMVNNDTVVITPSTTNQTIPKGYHSGVGYVKGDSNLVSANIKGGSSIFGVSGSSVVVDTSDATASASQILSGYSTCKNGSKITGSMTNRSTTSVDLLTSSNTNGDTQVEFTIPQGYYDGNTKKYISDANLIPSNIKNGESIFGVTGNVVAGGRYYGVTSRTGQQTTNYGGEIRFNPFYEVYSKAGFIPRALTFRGYMEAYFIDSNGSNSMIKYNPFNYMYFLSGDYYYEYTTSKYNEYNSYEYYSPAYKLEMDSVSKDHYTNWISSTTNYIFNKDVSLSPYQQFQYKTVYYELEAFGQ